jgi:hypothetical protein
MLMLQQMMAGQQPSAAAPDAAAAAAAAAAAMPPPHPHPPAGAAAAQQQAAQVAGVKRSFREGAEPAGSGEAEASVSASAAAVAAAAAAAGVHVGEETSPFLEFMIATDELTQADHHAEAAPAPGAGPSAPIAGGGVMGKRELGSFDLPDLPPLDSNMVHTMLAATLTSQRPAQRQRHTPAGDGGVGAASGGSGGAGTVAASLSPRGAPGHAHAAAGQQDEGMTNVPSLVMLDMPTLSAEIAANTDLLMGMDSGGLQPMPTSLFAAALLGTGSGGSGSGRVTSGSMPTRGGGGGGGGSGGALPMAGSAGLESMQSLEDALLEDCREGLGG